MTTPPKGDVVTYLDTSDPDHGGFQKAIVTGNGVLDPESDVVWLEAVRTDGEPALVDPGLILTTMPPPGDRGPVGIFADALGLLAFELTGVTEGEPMAQHTARHLLARFNAAIAPIAHPLFLAAEADAGGGLATVLGCVTLAAEHFGHGDVGNGKAGILIAHSAMAELIAPDLDDSDFWG